MCKSMNLGEEMKRDVIDERKMTLYTAVFTNANADAHVACYSHA